MGRICIILIIGTVVLLTSTTFILANPPEKATMEVRKEHMKIEHEGTKHEREIKKEKRKNLMKAESMLRMHMLLKYIGAQRGAEQINRVTH